MATGFVVDKIFFPTPPPTPQVMTLEYKLWSAPESSYVVISNHVHVATDGTVLESPLPAVTGLTANTVYYLRSSNNCSSPAEYFTKAIPT